MEHCIRLIRKELGMTQEELAGKLGIGKSALSMIETGKTALSERNKNILVQELNVNPDWFDTMRGEMFNCPKEECIALINRDRAKGREYLIPRQSVPLYHLDATAGLVPLFLNQEDYTPIDYIHIPNLPKCDGAIYVAGDSMYPLLKSGDIILYKRINSIDGVFWGDMYLLSIYIDGEEYVTVKYVQRSERDGYVKLVSQNPHHADKDVQIDSIRALALVKASIRMNSLK